jgi:hypothetical protein
MQELPSSDNTIPTAAVAIGRRAGRWNRSEGNEARIDP